MSTPRLRGDAGETLVESIITIAIMGIAFVAILYAIASAFQLSDVHRDQADTAVALGAAAEAVKGANPTTCSGLSPGSYTLPPPPPGVTTSVTSATCPAPNPGALKLQTITIQATTPDGAIGTTEVVKRSSDA